MSELQTVTYTREDDAKIAEALGWVAIHYLSTTGRHVGIPSDGGDTQFIPTYASDPSPDTEWEIKQWAREQDGKTQRAILDALDEIITARVGYSASCWNWLLDRELGDWANAILLKGLQDE